MLIKTGFLPPIIFMGVGALTDFGPMLRNLRLSIFGAAAQLGIFTVLLVAILMGFTPKEAASLGCLLYTSYKSGKAKEDFLEDVAKRRAEKDKSPEEDAKPKTDVYKRQGLYIAGRVTLLRNSL